LIRNAFQLGGRIPQKARGDRHLLLSRLRRIANSLSSAYARQHANRSKTSEDYFDILQPAEVAG